MFYSQQMVNPSAPCNPFERAANPIMSPLPMLLQRANVGGNASLPGVAPDTHNTLYKYTVACPVLSYILVGTTVLARIYTKVCVKPGFEVEDCMALAKLHPLLCKRLTSLSDTCVLAWVSSRIPTSFESR